MNPRLLLMDPPTEKTKNKTPEQVAPGADPDTEGEFEEEFGADPYEIITF